MDRMLATDPDSVIAVEPENWIDGAGHVWRVLATADGPEVRPGLQSPFLRQGALPRITAVLVTPARVLVELSMREWREVAILPAGDIAVRDLGLAMLTGIELPHEGIDRVGREVWDAADRRWTQSRAAGRVAVPVHGSRSLA
jgi:hypothetical protein